MSKQIKIISGEKATTGAWVLHHDQKLTAVRSPDFGNISLAGRAGRLLSVMSKEDEWDINNDRLTELARVNGIEKFALPGLLEELRKAGLIDRGNDGVAVLGVTQASLLGHTADLFESQQPEKLERAVIDLAERASQSPVARSDCEEEISDTHKLSKSERDDLFSLSEQIGFVDFENGKSDRLYFNGSLFSRENAEKAKNVLEGLNAEEQKLLLEADHLLSKMGCAPAETLKKLLGPILWSKLHQIAYYEVSVVANERGATEFVMKPASLAKFVPGGLADMLDDAKALASSLTYGIVKSSNVRGAIRDPEVLIKVFINRGYVEGWAEALREDYKLLERRGVVTVTSSNKGHRLTLNKPEVAEMARELILKGDATQAAVHVAASQSAAQFYGPDHTRHAERLKDIPEAKSGAARALSVLRKTR
ncbi:hypothetical protein ELI00_06455 [Rhizobium ruizarguesonis]|uniref:hypothetical protein n=1 Tax=Rhizobium ruizarguesonis TaxID=2081791 RepID=UPI00102FF079|nr:hypothetical protein [Rhizobium ruizarguesonis]TAX75916.1 hypothetical protein ELI00_06455 [Rhizobium ruizarguesonis]TBA79859.1 hypothetical protein ELH56_06270 [Rhizobium ruizarguesonis]